MRSRELHNAYQLGIDPDGSVRYSLSVRESQGFMWNPDLFAGRYYRRNSDQYYDDDHEHSPSVTEIHVDEQEDIFPHH